MSENERQKKKKNRNKIIDEVTEEREKFSSAH